MNFLIITSHPYGESFNAGVVKAIDETVTKNGHTAEVIDLVADQFNPVMNAEDLKLWKEGKTADPLVQSYMAKIEQADVLVFPFPVWWSLMPAVLKGFFDKVFIPGWAYKYGEKGELIGLMTTKKAVVINTLGAPENVYAEHMKNPIENAFVKGSLRACGIQVLKHMLIGKINAGGPDYAEQKMQEITAFFQSL